MLAVSQINTSLIQKNYPSLIKYMGSKSKIMDFVLLGINEIYQGGDICDLFSGSGSLAGAIGQQCAVHSNDIQTYSRVLAATYNQAYRNKKMPTSQEVTQQAIAIIQKNKKSIDFFYSKDLDLTTFNKMEKYQRQFINEEFDYEWHLFAKNYSGTWWSYEQCLWIDALREISHTYEKEPFYPIIISSIMFAMAYASQGTGHYAQYRDAKTPSSLKDISIYRARSIEKYFIRKYDELSLYIPSTKPIIKHKATSVDYRDCLKNFRGGTVYADPPYCFVHYSRFYHALETLVLYDFPELQFQKGTVVKGRYRENRHQSPFCIKTQVSKAFFDLFHGIKDNDSNLVLSYCNTGMITIKEIEEIALSVFPKRKIEIITTDHKHMTLGRKSDRHRDVKECLLLMH